LPTYSPGCVGRILAISGPDVDSEVAGSRVSQCHRP
jgi:hypothetical protein